MSVSSWRALALLGALVASLGIAAFGAWGLAQQYDAASLATPGHPLPAPTVSRIVLLTGLYGIPFLSGVSLSATCLLGGYRWILGRR